MSEDKKKRALGSWLDNAGTCGGSSPKCGKVSPRGHHAGLRASPYRTERPLDLLEQPSVSGLGQDEPTTSRTGRSSPMLPFFRSAWEDLIGGYEDLFQELGVEMTISRTSPEVISVEPVREHSKGDVSGPQSAPSAQGGQPQESNITSGLATSTVAPRDVAKAARKKKKSRRTSNFVTPYNLRSKKKTVSKQPATTSSQPATTGHKPPPKQDAAAQQKDNSEAANVTSLIREQEDNPPKMSDEKQKPVRKLKSWLETAGQFSGSPGKYQKVSPRRLGGLSGLYTSKTKNIVPRRGPGQRRRQFSFSEDEPSTSQAIKSAPITQGSSSNITLSSALRDYFAGIGDIFEGIGPEATTPRSSKRDTVPSKKIEPATTSPQPAATSSQQPPPSIHDEPSASTIQSATITHGSSIPVDENEKNVPKMPACKKTSLGGWLDSAGRYSPPKYQKVSPRRLGGLPRRVGQKKRRRFFSFFENEPSISQALETAAITNNGRLPANMSSSPWGYFFDGMDDIFEGRGPEATMSRSDLPTNAPERPVAEKAGSGRKARTSSRSSKRDTVPSKKIEPATTSPQPTATSSQQPPPLIPDASSTQCGNLDLCNITPGSSAKDLKPRDAENARKRKTRQRTSNPQTPDNACSEQRTASLQPATTSSPPAIIIDQPPPSKLKKISARPEPRRQKKRTVESVPPSQDTVKKTSAQPKPNRGNKRVAESVPMNQDYDQRRRSKRIRLPVTPGVRYGFHYALHEFDEFGFKKILGVRKIVDKDSAEYKASIVEIKKRKPRPKKPPASKGKKTGARPKRRRNDDNTRMAESAPVDQDLAEPEPMEDPSQNLSGRTVGMRTASNELRRVALSDLVVVGGGSWAVEPQKKHMCDGVSFTSPLNTDTKQGRLVIAPGCTKAERRASRGTLACLVEEGTVQLALGGQVVELKAGSQFQVPYENTYTLHNGQSTEAVIFYVLSPEAV